MASEQAKGIALEDGSSIQIKSRRTVILWLVAPITFSALLTLCIRSYLCFSVAAKPIQGQAVGHLLRSMPAGHGIPLPLNEASKWLEGTTIYRVVPGHFPSGMEFHFDGLAMAMAFTFKGGQLHYHARHFESKLYRQYDHCIFLGMGTGPKMGSQLCWQNPVVNLLPIANQLWLTVDSAYWGRVDPLTLETIPGKVKTTDMVLNAHPACDPATNECYVQYGCQAVGAPYTNQACIAQLVPGKTDLHTKLLAQVTLPHSLLIQHSHSLCLTPNYFVAKLESFGLRSSCPNFPLAGLLQVLHQVERNVWLVMHRKTLETRVMTSGNYSFVNNHFWNCYESDDGVVAEAVAVTGDYLDCYFRDSLKQSFIWDRLLYPPLRCTIPFKGQEIQCEQMLQDKSVIFDYPTYNPVFKMNPVYRYVYGVSIVSEDSRFYDSLVKINVKERTTEHRWSKSDVYPTEANFITKPNASSEDDGILFTIVYNSAKDQSAVNILDAATLQLLDEYPLDRVVPFHAHGIVCIHDHQKCFTNP